MFFKTMYYFVARTELLHFFISAVFKQLTIFVWGLSHDFKYSLIQDEFRHRKSNCLKDIGQEIQTFLNII